MNIPSTPSAPPVSREASKVPPGPTVTPESVERSKSGPVAILKETSPTQLQEIFPDGIPVRDPFPSVVELAGSLAYLAQFDPPSTSPPAAASVLFLDPNRCSAETLFQLATYLADQVQAAGGDDTAELILSSIAEGAEIPLRMKHVRVVVLMASVQFLPCPCAKCTAAREGSEGLVS